MVDVATLDSLKQLSADDRRELVEELWLSLADEPFFPELTDDLRQELERRRDAVIAHPEQSRTWEEFVPLITAEVKALLDERLADDEANPNDVMTWAEMKAELRAERGQA